MGKPMDWAKLLKHVSVILLIILTLQTLVGGGYLFFHTVVEMACVLIGLLMYVFASYTYPYSQNRFLLFLGSAYLFISILDFFHLITFSGMNVFPDFDTNVPTQLWIAGRMLEGISLFLIPIISERRFPLKSLNLLYGVFTLGSIVTIMRLNVFPTCYIEGVGLTGFKIGVEYLICLLIGGGMYFLWKRKEIIAPSVYMATMGSMTLTIVSELALTLYNTIGLWNMLGHIPKMISYYLLFWEVIVQGLETPYQHIFKELKEKNEQLEILNEKKNKFLGIVAHDLRNPLSIITMSSQVLHRSGTLDKKQISFLQRIKTSSEYMLQLVEELLDLTKIEAGHLHLNLQTSDIANIVENTVILNQTLAGDKNILLNYSYEPEISPVTLDPLKIEQVVNNLISNAIKYSYPGSQVKIGLTEDQNQVVLRIEDHGQGIPAEEMPLLFTPYAKISSKATAGEKSTGLGLAISRRIVDGHNGQIWAESQLGQGTTFYVTLPKHLTTAHVKSLTS